MKLPQPCGPVTRQVVDELRAASPGPRSLVLEDGPVLLDRDTQLGLWLLYEMAYRGFEDVDPAREWDPVIVTMRSTIERRLEHELRESVSEVLAGAPDHDDVGNQVLAMARENDGPKLSSYLRRDADAEQMRDYLRERSVQQLKESDPQSFLLPRLEGAAKVALAEIQYDEYGAGRVENLHQTLYVRALESVGLDPAYGAYVTEVSAVSLASANVMSMFALNRRLCGAGLGHFAAFEASSAVPSRRIAAGLERLGMDPAAAVYFLEHVEADSVHEQVAARDLCGSFLEVHPELRQDVIFGAACAVHLDALSGAELLTRWHSDDTEQAS